MHGFKTNLNPPLGSNAIKVLSVGFSSTVKLCLLGWQDRSTSGFLSVKLHDERSAADLFVCLFGVVFVWSQKEGQCDGLGSI